MHGRFRKPLPVAKQCIRGETVFRSTVPDSTPAAQGPMTWTSSATGRQSRFMPLIRRGNRGERPAANTHAALRAESSLAKMNDWFFERIGNVSNSYAVRWSLVAAAGNLIPCK